ncbi:uncharacterized protein LOC120703697 isoform X4 [Panicum virgatum]|uniref:uncharacterized protein LOC120703697 isoform X4 n=1 Tax=Panicum virgatum TaxID=38727 RepID=UPI0019D5762D|nr:uncharacterized protein LOC120703697 isoform X4 [Panicum virgatum]
MLEHGPLYLREDTLNFLTPLLLSKMRHSGVWTGQTGRQRLVGRVEARQEEAIFTSTPSTATCGVLKHAAIPGGPRTTNIYEVKVADFYPMIAI